MADGHRAFVGATLKDTDHLNPTTPITWTNAKQLVKANTLDALSKLRRSTEQSLHYRACKAQTLKEYASLEDSIKIRLLQYNHKLNNESLKMATHRKEAEFMPVFVLNEFPYFFEASIKHYVIWSEKQLTDEEVGIVIHQNTQGYESIWFRNPPPLQSIPDLWHVHVLTHPQ